ncbi:MAG: hypothetical protein FWH41_02755 [Treponema sp.]|nr:hypothetical protein [Treponema sp.]
MKRIFFNVCCNPAFFLLWIFCACSATGENSIQREDLFSLDIGPMEDQVALYGLEGDGGIRQAELTMREGIFYITDSNNGKIVRYNSYGDLLFMIYNDETNPHPSDLKEKTEDSAQLTRWAFTYPLRSPGKIAVDSRKHIYTVERLPPDRHSFDSENRALLDSVVLHFDADGRFIEYLGQGGQGGGPFPYVAGIYASAQNEIAVVCRLPGAWNIFWYGAFGEQLFLIQLKDSSIPPLPLWPGLTASIDSIMAAPDERKLYIKVDYYRDVFDESTNTRVSTEPLSSHIWILNVEDGIYDTSVEVPFYEYSFTENNKTVNVKLLYSMLGLIRGGGILLCFPVETGYTILQMDSGGRGQRRFYIKIAPEELRFNVFYLSPEGILSALLADDWNIKVVWWRLDKFLKDSQ